MRTCEDIQEVRRIISKSEELTKDKSNSSKDGQSENDGSESEKRLQELWSTKAFQNRLERLKRSHYSLTNKSLQRRGVFNKKDIWTKNERNDVSQVRHGAGKNNIANLKQFDRLNEQETIGSDSEMGSGKRDVVFTEKLASSSVTSSISLDFSSEQNGSTFNTSREHDVKCLDFTNHSNHLDVEIKITKSAIDHCPSLDISHGCNENNLNAQNDSTLPVVWNEKKGTRDRCSESSASCPHGHVERVNSPNLIRHSFGKDEDSKIMVSEKLTYSNMVRARLLNGGNSHLSVDMECYGNPPQSMFGPLKNSPIEDFDEEGEGSVYLDLVAFDEERIRGYNKIPSEFKGIDETANAESSEILIPINFIAENNQRNCTSRTNETLNAVKSNTVDEARMKDCESFDETKSTDLARTSGWTGIDVSLNEEIGLTDEKGKSLCRNISKPVLQRNADISEQIISQSAALEEPRVLDFSKMDIKETMHPISCGHRNSIDTTNADKNSVTCDNGVVENDIHSSLQIEFGHAFAGERTPKPFIDKNDGLSENHIKQQNLKSKMMTGNLYGKTNTKHLNQGVNHDNLNSGRSVKDQTKDDTTGNLTGPPQDDKTHVVDVDNNMLLSSNNFSKGNVRKNVVNGAVIEKTSFSFWPLRNDTIGRDANLLQQVFDPDMISSSEIGSEEIQSPRVCAAKLNAVNSPIFQHQLGSKVNGSEKEDPFEEVSSKMDANSITDLFGHSMKTSKSVENCYHGNPSISIATPSRVSICQHSVDEKQNNMVSIMGSEWKSDLGNYEWRSPSDLSSPKSPTLPLFSSPAGHSISPCSQGSAAIEDKNMPPCHNLSCSTSEKYLPLRSSPCFDDRGYSGESGDEEAAQTVLVDDELMSEKKIDYAGIQRRLQEFKKRAFIRNCTKRFASSNLKEESKTKIQRKNKGENTTKKNHQNAKNVNDDVADSNPRLSCVLTGLQFPVSAKPNVNVKKYKPRVKIKVKPRYSDKEKQGRNGKCLRSATSPKNKKQQATCFKVSTHDVSKLQACKDSFTLSQVKVSDIHHRKDSNKRQTDLLKESNINCSDAKQDNMQNRLRIEYDRNMSKTKLTSSKTNVKSETAASTGLSFVKFNKGNNEKAGLFRYSRSEKDSSKHISDINTIADHIISLPGNEVKKDMKAGCTITQHTTRNGRKELSNAERYHKKQVCATSLCQKAGHSDGQPQSKPPAVGEITMSVHYENVVSDDIQTKPAKSYFSCMQHEDLNIKSPMHSPELPHGHQHWRRRREVADNNRNRKDDSDDSSVSKTYRSLISEAISKARAQADKYKCIWGDSNKSKSVDKEAMSRNDESTKTQAAKLNNCPHLPLIKNKKLCDFQHLEGRNSNNNSCAGVETDSNGKTERQVANTEEIKEAQSGIQDNLNMCLSSEFGCQPSNNIAKDYYKNVRVDSRKNQSKRKSKIPVLIKAKSQRKMHNMTQDCPIKNELRRVKRWRYFCCGSMIDDYSNNRNINTAIRLHAQKSKLEMNDTESREGIVFPNNTKHQSFPSYVLISPRISTKDVEVVNTNGCSSPSGKVSGLKCRACNSISDFEKMRMDCVDEIQRKDMGIREDKTQTINKRDEFPRNDKSPIFKKDEYMDSVEMNLSACISNCSHNSLVSFDNLSPQHALIESDCFQTESGTKLPNLVTETDSTSTEKEPGPKAGISLTEDKPDQKFLQIIHLKVAAAMSGHNSRIVEICGSPTTASELPYSFNMKSKASQIGTLGDIGNQCLQSVKRHPRDMVAPCSEPSDGSDLPVKSSSFADRIVHKTTSTLGLSVNAGSMPALIGWPVPITSEFSPKFSRRPKPRGDLCQGITLSSPDSIKNAEHELSQNVQQEGFDCVPAHTKTTKLTDLVVHHRSIQSENDTHGSEEKVRSSEMDRGESPSPEVHQGRSGYFRYNVRVHGKDSKRVRFRKGSLTFCTEPPLCVPFIQSSPDDESTGNRQESMTDMSTDTDYDEDSRKCCRLAYDEKLDSKESGTDIATVHFVDIECSDCESRETPSDKETENGTQGIEISNTSEGIPDAFKDSIIRNSLDIQSMQNNTLYREATNVQEDITECDCTDSSVSDNDEDSYFEASTESFDRVFRNASKANEREKVHNNNEVRYGLPPLSKRQAGRPHKEMRKMYY